MNFSNITDWTITEGSVKRVTDSLGNVLWEKQTPPTPANDYFYVEDISGSANTLTIQPNSSSSPVIEVFYSTDKETWTSMGTTVYVSPTTQITATVPANGKLYLKATANTWANDTSNATIHFHCIDGNFNIGGNIMSLLNGDNFIGTFLVPVTNNYAFRRLFEDSRFLINANNLVLPNTVTGYCYQSMFYSCFNMVTAPALPATTLTEWCYNAMFYGTALTTAPVLPATTLATNCYNSMFGWCKSLSSVTTYANDISAYNCLSAWLGNVAATGTFHNLGSATYSIGVSGIPSGWTEVNS